ncbi:unnamed protein product [marine sediment metagenome]|uniref:Uncharacterized protein n=1 Tax=marine sediment metagenome TaxID=412755 RepID=X1EFP5_9ZZZZ
MRKVGIALGVVTLLVAFAVTPASAGFMNWYPQLLNPQVLEQERILAMYEYKGVPQPITNNYFYTYNTGEHAYSVFYGNQYETEYQSGSTSIGVTGDVEDGDLNVDVDVDNDNTTSSDDEEEE